MTGSKQLFIADGNGYYRVEERLHADDIIAKARAITASRMRRRADTLTAPQKVRDYLAIHLVDLEQEEFWGLFLDNRHRIISKECLFTGTIDSCAVYPREVGKRL